MKNQLFIIPAETYLALDAEECAATCAAMQEIGIYNLPYPKVDVWIAGDEIINIPIGAIDWPLFAKDLEKGLGYIKDGKFITKYGDGFYLFLNGLTLDSVDKVGVKFTGNKYFRDCEEVILFTDLTHGTYDKMLLETRQALITLLNTRNAVKSTEHNKLAKLGIGKKGKKVYEYVTTITMPKELDDAECGEAKPTGISKAPHLRRGHIRRQHYGPGNVLIKMKWIEPVFVNADKDWVDKRARYNISMGKIR